MLSTFIAVVLAAAASTTARVPKAPPALGEVHFQFDSAALPADANERLRKAADYAETHPGARIVLDAHCDPIGTNPYNVGLAIRRAESVRGTLTEMGVPREQIVFAIYGEDGARRATHAQDRRVTVWASQAPLTAVIDRTFTGGGAAVTWGKPLTTAEIEATPAPVARR